MFRSKRVYLLNKWNNAQVFTVVSCFNNFLVCSANFFIMVYNTCDLKIRIT